MARRIETFKDCIDLNVPNTRMVFPLNGLDKVTFYCVLLDPIAGAFELTFKASGDGIIYTAIINPATSLPYTLSTEGALTVSADIFAYRYGAVEVTTAKGGPGTPAYARITVHGEGVDSGITRGGAGDGVGGGGYIG